MAVTRIKNNQITDATIVASTKLVDYSVTSGKLANNLTYNSDFTIAGNLTVQGNVTAIDTFDLVVEDPLILLAKDQTGSSPSLDIGFIGERGDLTNIAWVWDESADEFAAAFTSSTITNTTITISSYASVHMLDLTAANANITGNVTFSGNIVGNMTITGNVLAGNLNSNAAVTGVTFLASGNITGANVNANSGIYASTADITGNVTAGNISTTGTLNVANISATGNITGGNLISNALIQGVTANISGNVDAGNLNTTGVVSATGNITGGNIATAGSLSVTGNANVGNLGTTGVYTTTLSATGNANVGNLGTSGLITATGNITGGNLLTGGLINATGNITGGNLNTTGQIFATGNITGGNLISNALVQGVTVTASGNLNGNNATITNAITTTTLTASGNVLAANLNANTNVTGTTITASGNLVGGNANITNGVYTATIETTGNALIGGNLVVNGNITYINIDDLRVEDPIIILGTGPNGAPLTTNDGRDRGVYMEYYTTDLGNAFMGWDNSTGNMLMASNVTIANDIVTVNSYGTFQTGNIYAESANVVGNVTAGNVTINNALNVANISASGNITGGNLISNALISGVTANISGNVNAGNVNTTGTANIGTLEVTGTTSLTGNVISTVNVTGNINTGNLSSAGVITATGNVTGGNLTTAGTANIGTLEVTGTTSLTGNIISTVNVTGNVNTGNLNTPGAINATGNITGGNLVSNAAVSAVTITASGNISGNNLSITNYANSANFNATGTVTTPNITSTGGLSVTTGSNGNITLDPNGTGNVILTDQTANRMLYTGPNKEVLTNANATYDGSDLVLIGSAQVDNVIVNGADITSNTTELTINDAGADVNFRVEGDTNQNLFIVDAGSDTVLINTNTPTTGATLAVGGADSILVPVGNTLQRPSGATGMIRFNTSTNALEFYDASQWVSAGTVFTVVSDNQFNGDGSTVGFTISQDSTTAATIVSINGVLQIPTVAYSVAGNVVTFTEAPLSTDVIDVRALTISTIVAAIQNTSGNAVFQGSTTSAGFDVTGNLIPTANITYDLGSSTARWKDLYLSGSSLILGNIVMKNTGGNTVGFFGPDGTTPATLDANVSIVGDAIESGTSNVSFASGNGNVLIVTGGNTTGVITATGANVAGYVTATGNVTGGNLVTAGLLSVNSGNSSGTVITNAGGNGVGNIGSASGFFNTAHVRATSALYADLAERYQADAPYAPGTVVEFGGSAEVTLCNAENSTRVAGVISTNPSYIMNAGLIGDNVVEVALTGRVPCQVVGPVRKGDLMVSAGNGAAKSNNDARAGAIIGKALENFDQEQGTIEVVVGRV